MALQDYYNTGDDSAASIFSIIAGQTFTTSSAYDITSVKLKLYREAGFSPGTLTVNIYATSAGLPTGSSLTSGTTNGNTLTTDTSGEWREITLTTYSLATGTVYAVTIQEVSYGANWRRDDFSTGYAGGEFVYSTNGGSSWQTDPIEYPDMMFEIYGTPTFSPPADIVTIRKLVAAASNKMWYEDV